MNDRYYRNVIQIRAEDSPNVKRGLWLASQGLPPDDTPVIPGILSYREYCKRRDTWDAERQTVGLDAEFYKGKEILLFPPEWLTFSEQLADKLSGRPRKVKAIGVDPAEGGDKTAMAAVDDFGLVDLVSRKTPNTNDIPREALAFMHKHSVPPEKVIFDRGGGGKQHADRLREDGFNVQTVAFGESIVQEPKRGLRLIRERVEIREEAYAYTNRRGQMYGTLSGLMDPSYGGFAIPRRYSVLRDQLGPIPRKFDKEGRLKLPPKNRVNDEGNKKERTLVELIGYSPDEADALVLAVFGMLFKTLKPYAGAIT